MNLISRYMKCFFIAFIYSIFITNTMLAQSKYNLTGYVYDVKNGEAILFANIYTCKLKTGTTTNEYGYYSLKLPPGKNELSISYIGYKNKTIYFDLQKDTIINIELEPVDELLNEITVEATRDKNRTKTINAEKLIISNLKSLPYVFGEQDVIKAIQIQPGVKSGGDGSGGMSVRGGGFDQNLILIDEAPVYNPSHMFGLVSVFNPDAINHVRLFKGNIPANFGGRLSSVVDVRQNNGNSKKMQLSGGISPFSGKATLQGPISSKSSFFISGRKSLSDLFLKPREALAFVPGFFDINAKVNYKINERQKLFFSFYKGKDNLVSHDGFSNVWGNTTGTLRFTSGIKDNFFFSTSFIYSKYDNDIEFPNSERKYYRKTAIEDLQNNSNFSWYLNSRHTVIFGYNTILHDFMPGKSNFAENSIPESKGIETCVYLLDEMELGKINMNIGLRWSSYAAYGDGAWYEYSQSEDVFLKKTNTTGIYARYSMPEPRINIEIPIKPRSSIQLGASRMQQFSQLLQNTGLSYTSIETWIPVSPTVKPQYADIFSGGWFYEISDNYYFSIEAYYKKLHEQVDYTDHADIISSSNIMKDIRVGKGRAYGLELMLKKNTGRLSGQVFYNYSRSFKKIKGINNGKEYPTYHDVPHDLKITGMFKLNKRIELSAVWMFMSGRPATIPTGYIGYSRYYTPIYSERNSGRLPDYHRLDFSFSLKPKESLKKYKGTLVIGLYNVYAHQNPLGYQFSFSKLDYTAKVYEYRFIRFFPNISYSFKFN